jgi:hypothetical protein
MGLFSMVVLQILLFRQLRQLQAATSQIGPMPPPEFLLHSPLLKVGPPLLIIFYVGCLFAALALVSLIFDNRRKS